jgi:hypothetical protein
MAVNQKRRYCTNHFILVKKCSLCPTFSTFYLKSKNDCIFIYGETLPQLLLCQTKVISVHVTNFCISLFDFYLCCIWMFECFSILKQLKTFFLIDSISAHVTWYDNNLFNQKNFLAPITIFIFTYKYKTFHPHFS